MQKIVLIFLTVALMSLTTMAQGESTERGVKPCPCNRFRVISNLEMVKSGDIVEFEAQSDEPSVSRRKFEWTISSGKIISGQGTNRVSVRAPSRESFDPRYPHSYRPGPRPFGSITAVAEYTDTNCTCPSASDTVAVGPENLAHNVPADVQDLQLSHTTATANCPEGHTPAREGHITGNTIFDVKTIATDPENDPLLYSYTVTGGRIVGTGAAVRWDVTGVFPGTYKIVAAVDDGCNYCGKAVEKFVTVASADCGGHCRCAVVEISSPDTVSFSMISDFVANVTLGTFDPIYNWSVVNGEIIEGQGTAMVKVKMPMNSTNKISSVTLEIGGYPKECSICPTQVTKVYENGVLKP